MSVVKIREKDKIVKTNYMKYQIPKIESRYVLTVTNQNGQTKEFESKRRLPIGLFSMNTKSIPKKDNSTFSETNGKKLRFSEINGLVFFDPQEKTESISLKLS